MVTSGNKSEKSGFSSSPRKEAAMTKDDSKEPYPLESNEEDGRIGCSGRPEDSPPVKPLPRTMFGCGRAKKKSSVFSLNKDNTLVKSRTWYGKARGRGHSERAADVSVTVGRSNYSAPKDDLLFRQTKNEAPKLEGGEMLVIEGEEELWDVPGSDVESRTEGLTQESLSKDESATEERLTDSISFSEMENKPGLPLRGSGVSRTEIRGEISPATIVVEGMTKVEALEQPVSYSAGVESQLENKSIPEKTFPHQQEWVAHQQTVSKPKRYSVQRQRTGGATEKGSQERVPG